MGRPRVLKLGDGEVSLSNFSKEEADRLENLVLGTKAPSENAEVKRLVVTGVVPHTAVGMHMDKDGYYYIAVLKYNELGECKLDNIQETKTRYRNQAFSNFKLKIFDLKIM